MDKRQIGLADLTLLEDLFAPLVDNPFFVKNDKLQYVAMNDAMLRLCGVSHRNQLLGRTAWEVYPAQSASHYERDEHHVLLGNIITDRLEMIVVDNRAPVWLLFSQIPIRDSDGKIVGIAGTSRRLDLRRRDNSTYARIAIAVGHIRKHFDKPLDLKRLCSVSKLSASQLERDFRHLLRASPRQYQQKVRIERALMLLLEGRPVAEIAHSCGFSEHSAFSRRFKEAVGVTPSQYRSNR